MTTESLIIFLIVGIAAGWLAGILVKGGGFGLLGDMIVGVIGAFIGGWIFARLGIATWGLLGLLLMALVGAIVLIAVIRLLKQA